MFSPEQIDLLRLLAKEWDTAEGVIKRAEHLNGAVVIPSINEMRYAGRRIVDAVNSLSGSHHDDGVDADTFLRDARLRCICAQHDALDASITFVHLHVRHLESAVGVTKLHGAFPRIADLRAEIVEISDLVVQSRAFRNGRAEAYGRILNEAEVSAGLDEKASHFDNLLRLYRNMIAVEPKLLAEVEQEKKSSRSNAQMAVIGLAVGVVGTLLGVFGAVLGVVGLYW